MGEVKSNVSYECKNCGAKGTLVENVESINLNEIKKLPCGCRGKYYGKSHRSF